MPKKAAKSPFRDFPAKDWFNGHPHNSQKRSGRWYDFDPEDDVPGGWWARHCPRNLAVLAEFLADGLRRFRDAPYQPEYATIDDAAPGGSHVPFPDPVQVFNRLFWGLADVQLANVWLDHHGVHSHERPAQPQPVEWPREVSPLATSVERQMVYREPLTEPERRMLESEIPRVDRELSELWRWVANRAGGELSRANDTQGKARSDQTGDLPKDTVSTVPALHAHEPKHDRLESEIPHLEPALIELPQQAADRLEQHDEPSPAGTALYSVVRASVTRAQDEVFGQMAASIANATTNRPVAKPVLPAEVERKPEPTARRQKRGMPALAVEAAVRELVTAGATEITLRAIRNKVPTLRSNAAASKAIRKMLESQRAVVPTRGGLAMLNSFIAQRRPGIFTADGDGGGTADETVDSIFDRIE